MIRHLRRPVNPPVQAPDTQGVMFPMVGGQLPPCCGRVKLPLLFPSILRKKSHNMVLYHIMAITGLKKIALKSLASKAYIETRLKLSPSYQRAKKSLQAGTAILPVGVAKVAYHSSKAEDFSALPGQILKIIQSSYASESFYYATWKEKARLLARQIVLVPDIKEYMSVFRITKRELADTIYQILRRNKNRQGNPQLAREIARLVGG